MVSTQSRHRYQIEFNTADPIVKSCRDRASFNGVVGWMMFAACLFLGGVFVTQSSSAGTVALIFATLTTSFGFMAQSSNKKNAWIRTLEIRIAQLEKGTTDQH